MTELAAAVVSGIVLTSGRPELRPSLRIVPRVAIAAGIALLPMLLTGIPVIARLAISTAMYGAALLAMRALPAELGALLPTLRPWRRPAP